MRDDVIVAVRHDEPTRTEVGRFDQTSIALHWLTLVLVVTQFATAWLLDVAGANHTALLTAHRSTGQLTWVVVVARLAWRWWFAHLPPFPASMPRFQQRMAKLNEYLLYGLLLLQPLTGLGDTLFRGRPFGLFGLHVPGFLPANKPVHLMLHTAHEVGANALLLLIAVHAAAALMHGLILRDGVAQRMSPWTHRDSDVS